MGQFPSGRLAFITEELTSCSEQQRAFLARLVILSELRTQKLIKNPWNANSVRIYNSFYESNGATPGV